MKRPVRILGLVIMVVAIFSIFMGCGSSRRGFSDLVNPEDKIRTYEVFGMDCPGCHDGLENLVNKISGVKTSLANWEKQRLQVALYPDARVDDEAIYEAIKKANFTPGKRLE